jgi:fatty acid CoA ligase FadD9
MPSESVLLCSRLILICFCGGLAAASTPAVNALMREIFNDMFYEGYACTEAGAIAGDDGSIRPGVEFRLVDVPEMGYHSTDLPFPRGELLVKTQSMVSGYFNNATENAGAFTEDGFFCTGDVVELFGERRVRVIDRKKNIFKLAGGEFVCPQSVEKVVLESPIVRQVRAGSRVCRILLGAQCIGFPALLFQM